MNQPGASSHEKIFGTVSMQQLPEPMHIRYDREKMNIND
jgi:hypothetical protein